MNHVRPYLALAMSTVTMIGGGGALIALKSRSDDQTEAVKCIRTELSVFRNQMSRVDHRLDHLDSHLDSSSGFVSRVYSS